MATANGNFRWPTLCYFSPFCSHSSSGLPRNIFNLGSFVKTVPENISLKEKKRKARVVGFEMSWNLIFSIIKKKSFDKFFEKLISKSKHLCLEEWKLSRFSPKEVREKWALFFSVCVCDVIKVSRLPCRHAYYLWLVRGLNADFFIGNFTRNSSYLNDDFEKKSLLWTAKIWRAKIWLVLFIFHLFARILVSSPAQITEARDICAPGHKTV